MGKTRAFDQDHPRLCGEKYLAYDKTVPADGSPPPMRGKGTGDATIFQRCRITPAYAGKRLERVPLIPSRQDHPRLCGEKHVFPALAVLVLGSPPPMRGKGLELDFYKSGNGITPAYAGKSCRPPTEIITIGDHPRLCGEKMKYQCDQ